MSNDSEAERDSGAFVEAAAKPKGQKDRNPPALSIYLGSEADSLRRMKALDFISQRLGLRGRSTLIQWIADGRLLVVAPATSYEGPPDFSQTAPTADAVAEVGVTEEKADTVEMAREADTTEEVRRYIEEHIDEFVREERGWHMDLARAIVEYLGLPIEEIDRVRDMVHAEARRRRLPSNYAADGSRMGG